MKLLSFIGSLLIIGSASAADITIYYSTTCPHCHYAREFIDNELVYEYKTIKVNAANVMEPENLTSFRDALEKCDYDTGGVPLIIIGKKCFQGYGPKMNQDLRDAVSVDLSDQEKSDAVANIKLFQENPEKFRAKNSDRANAVSEIGQSTQKKTEDGTVIYFYILLGVSVAGLGFVLLRKKGEK